MSGVYSIDIDLETGDAFIASVFSNDYMGIVRLDSSCSQIIDTSTIPIQESPGSLFIDQGRYGLLPFSIEIVGSPNSSNGQLGFSITTDNGLEFDDNVFMSAPTEIEGVLTGDEDSVEFGEPSKLVEIWGDGNAGVNEVKAGSLPGLAFETSRTLDRIVRLPRFSWSSSAIQSNLLFFVGRDNGQIDQYRLNENVIANKGEVFTLSKSRSGRLNPLLKNPITGIAANLKSQTIYFSSQRGVEMLDVSTLQPLAFVNTSPDFIACEQEPPSNLWGVSPANGYLYTLNRDDISSSSTESTEVKTTSSSLSSSSSISSSSVSSSSVSSTSSSTARFTTSSRTSISTLSSSSQSSSSPSSSSSISTSSSKKFIDGTHWVLYNNVFNGSALLSSFNAVPVTAFNTLNGTLFLRVTIRRGFFWSTGTDWRIEMKVTIEAFRDPNHASGNLVYSGSWSYMTYSGVNTQYAYSIALSPSPGIVGAAAVIFTSPRFNSTGMPTEGVFYAYARYE